MRWTLARWGEAAMLIIALAVAPLGSTYAAAAEQDAEEEDVEERLLRLLDNKYYKINIDIRARIELADFENLESSQAYTIRTLAGIGSKPFYGLSGYAELINTLPLDNGTYWDTVEPPTGQSPIAEVENTDLHQLFARYQNAELFGVDATIGRQRITLDDQRFIGDIAWRQNEQVYDAARGATTLGIDHLRLEYGYIEYVTRIFANQGAPPMRNYRSNSHFAHVGYDAWSSAKIVGFAYLLDFDNSPVNSSNSFGMRVVGSAPITPTWVASYAGSYAVQTDAANNPIDYVAHYVAAEGGVTYLGLGGVALGYELLSSDDGVARFVTPLATAHKFNGWADAFLDNGGPNGLQDLYTAVTPQLPLALKSALIYHHFWSDEHGDSLGWEIDGVLSRAFGRYITVLTKIAYFDGDKETLPDRWRAWLDVTFRF